MTWSWLSQVECSVAMSSCTGPGRNTDGGEARRTSRSPLVGVGGGQGLTPEGARRYDGSAVALSVDDEATTQNLISRQGLTFPRPASPDEPFRAKQAAEERSALLVAQGGQQPLEILAARAARAQVSRQARIPLFGRSAGGRQLRLYVQCLHRLGAAHVARVSPQEIIQRRPAVHELPEQSSIYPWVARADRSLRRRRTTSCRSHCGWRTAR